MRTLSRQLARRWPDIGERRSLCVGIGPGARLWPSSLNMVRALPGSAGGGTVPGENVWVRTEEFRLPFPDNRFERILVVNKLEQNTNTTRLLRELWRVAAPESHLIVAATHKLGLWGWQRVLSPNKASTWSRPQLQRALRMALFEPLDCQTLLHAPPGLARSMPGVASTWEGLAGTCCPHFGGLLLIEAMKRVEAPTGPGLLARQRAALGNTVSDGRVGARFACHPGMSNDSPPRDRRHDDDKSDAERRRQGDRRRTGGNRRAGAAAGRFVNAAFGAHIVGQSLDANEPAPTGRPRDETPYAPPPGRPPPAGGTTV